MQRTAAAASSSPGDKAGSNDDETSEWEVLGVVVSLVVASKEFFLVEWKQMWGSERPDADNDGVVIFDDEIEEDSSDPNLRDVPIDPWRSLPSYMSWLVRDDMRGAPDVLAAHAQDGQRVLVHSAGSGWEGFQAVDPCDHSLDLTGDVSRMLHCRDGWTKIEGWDMVATAMAEAPATAAPRRPVAAAEAGAAALQPAAAAAAAPNPDTSVERFYVLLQGIWAGRMEEVRTPASLPPVSFFLLPVLALT